MRLPLTAAVLGVLLASAAGGQTPSLPDEAALTGRPVGTLVTNAGAYDGHPADWGVLLVPERRGAPDARPIRLIVVREHALAGTATRPPLFNLVGGPGSSNIWGAGEIPPALMTDADVVRVGYRGIDSTPGLVCPEYTRASRGDDPLDAASIARRRAGLRACFDRLTAAGVDVDGYTLEEVVDDIEATRAALGADRIDFLAASYGTQIAYAYAMRYPGRVHRMLFVAAGGRARGLDLWGADMLDAKLAAYGRLWQRDAEAVARAPDILAVMRTVLAGLPRTWRGVRIDPGKVRLGAWFMLRSTGGAAQVLDAFVTAAAGDDSGLALLSWVFDQELEQQLTQRYGPYDGEFFSKVVSSCVDPGRDYVAETEDVDTLLGAPAARYMLGAGRGWPITPIDVSARRNRTIDVETLILMGNLDVATPHEYVEAELMPHLTRGHLVVLSEMGHMDPASLQPEAFVHTAARWLTEGAVDVSKFTYHRPDFTPADTLSDYAKSVIPVPDGEAP